MTVSTVNKETRPAPGWARRLGGAGVVAWVATGLVTAFLDPRAHGAGIISLFGGVGAWMATGIGLIATALLAIAVYRRRGRPAALVAGMVCLAVVTLALVAVDWNAVTESVVVVTGIAVATFGLLGGVSYSTEDTLPLGLKEDGDGWRHGYDGYGYYLHNMRYMNATSMDDDDE